MRINSGRLGKIKSADLGRCVSAPIFDHASKNPGRSPRFETNPHQRTTRTMIIIAGAASPAAGSWTHRRPDGPTRWHRSTAPARLAAREEMMKNNRQNLTRLRCSTGTPRWRNRRMLQPAPVVIVLVIVLLAAALALAGTPTTSTLELLAGAVAIAMPAAREIATLPRGRRR
ncbi:hypothetical protein ACFWA9_07920 [Kitasatospora sp. NPDC059973]|uniref:hypothetical protein n=1 Tax=Kitasatospora sp. NPDC059973 TaxID=3347020 RepID=UPI0036CF0F82